MRINLSYGKGHLPINLSDDWEVTVVRKPKMNIHNAPAAAVERALRAPVGCDKFVKPNGPDTSVCILVCDITRPVPNGVILPVLVRYLIEVGVDAKDITILVATGLHRPNEGEELAEVIGD